MIAYLRGNLEEWRDDAVVLDVNGVGYEVLVPKGVLAALPPTGNPLCLYTHEYLRENEHSLFGFKTREERRVFELVLGVNGVGPRTALNLLSAMSPDDFLLAVQEGNTATLATVSGIGKKTAQRIILELQNRVGALQPFLFGASAQRGVTGEAIRALISLGASELNAEAAVMEAKRTLGDDATLETLITTALRAIRPQA